MKIIVADDSVLYRKVLGDFLGTLPFVDELLFAADGGRALSLALDEKPDLMTLDLEMPVMNGLQVLRELKRNDATMPVLVLSAQSDKGTEMAVGAMELGAMDVLLKPSGHGGHGDSLEALKRRLRLILQAYVLEQQRASLSSLAHATSAASAVPSRPEFHARPRLLAMGASTGGPSVLDRIMPRIPAGFPAPIVIALHMLPGFSAMFAARLARRCSVEVVEASDGDVLLPGRAYLAPAGSQMTVEIEPGSSLVKVHVRDDPDENHARPSVDQLFSSVAEVYGGRAVAVILTGMGKDGVKGLARLRARGARVLAQDSRTSLVFGMPRAAIEAGLVDMVASPESIADHILYAWGQPT